MATSAQRVKATTQQHLDIEDIAEDLVILKTGWVALVMSTTAVNFDILSEAEQDATIYAYGALLNSLTFPIQILIRSKRADITSYYTHLVESEKKQQNPDLKRQIQNYMDFIQSTVQQKTILDKRFYLVLSFSPIELGLGGLKKQDKSKGKEQLIQDAKVALAPKRNHLIKQTARLGLTTRQLTTKEIIELFYDIYNPAPTGTQRVILDSASYTTPMVEPAIENPAPAPNQPQQQVPPEPDTTPQVGPQPTYADSLPNVNQQQQPQQTPNQAQALDNLKAANARVAQSIYGEQQISPTSRQAPVQQQTAAQRPNQ